MDERDETGSGTDAMRADTVAAESGGAASGGSAGGAASGGSAGGGTAAADEDEDEAGTVPQASGLAGTTAHDPAPAFAGEEESEGRDRAGQEQGGLTYGGPTQQGEERTGGVGGH